MTGIVVTGMHRSGTSMVTRLINMLGADVGPADRLLPAGPGNVTGYWERWDVMAINESLLRAYGCRWDRVDRWTASASTPVAAGRAVSRVAREMTRVECFVVKDPRFCLTLPHWREALGEPVVVVVSRNPWHVAHSLHRRDAMPVSYALALWEYYSVSVLNLIRTMRCVYADVTDALSQPMAFVTALHDALINAGVRGLHLPDDDVHAFVDPRLDHSEGASAPLTRHQRRLIEMLAGAPVESSGVLVSEIALTTLKVGTGAIHK